VENLEQVENATSAVSCRCIWVSDCWFFCIWLGNKIVRNSY